MGVSFPVDDADVEDGVQVGDAVGDIEPQDGGAVSMVIDADWSAADLARMLTALDDAYEVFLAIELYRRSSREGLGSTGAGLPTLLPADRLAIPAMRFASKGVFSFEGLGEVVREVKDFLMGLETIGQRRKRNRLELEKKEAEMAALRDQREAQKQSGAADLARQLQQDELELMRIRQEVMGADLDLAAKHLQLTVQKFEAAYGPEWRNVDGTLQQFERLLGAGNQLLTEFREGRIALPPAPEEPHPTGDGGF